MAQQGQEKKNENKPISKSGNEFEESKGLEAGNTGGWQQPSGSASASASGSGSKMSAIPGGKSKEEEGESEEETTSAQSATALFRRGKEMATDLAGRAQEYGTDASKEVSAVLKKYPLQSIAVGFGLGILAGSLISRR